jgi:hypothetical protein
MSKIQKLIKINGNELTFKFSPEGYVSSVRLGKQNVITEMKYVKEDDYEKYLNLFGFRKKWAKEIIILVTYLNEKLSQYNFEVCNIIEIDIGVFNVSICNKKDFYFIHKIKQGVFCYSVLEKRFVKVVKQFNLTKDMCNKILEIKYV